MIDKDLNGLGVRCMMCGRTPDSSPEKEKEKERQKALAQHNWHNTFGKKPKRREVKSLNTGNGLQDEDKNSP